jgi:hypothetical protein
MPVPLTPWMVEVVKVATRDGAGELTAEAFGEHAPMVEFKSRIGPAWDGVQLTETGLYIFALGVPSTRLSFERDPDARAIGLVIRLLLLGPAGVRP